MPLVTLSKILSSKTFARNSQLYSSSTTTASTVSVSASDYTAQHQHHHHLELGSPSLKTPPRAPSSASTPNKSGGSPQGSVARNRDRTSKAFTFSIDPFNVVASLRTRSSKLKTVHSSHPEGTLCPSARPVSHQSRSVSVSAYSGYEDEEYGEPEVDAEEIRRPSGLGRRASLTDMDMSTEVGEEIVGKYGADQASVNEFRTAEKVIEETESRHSISDTSDMESLVEIRYPSGLGKIKLALHPCEVERPLSTYPHFGPSDLSYSNTHIVAEDTPAPVLPQSPRLFSPPSLSASSYISSLLPILTPYLSPRTLTSLACVDHAVGKTACEILWRSINISVTIRSAQKQNNQNGNGNNGSRNKNGKMCMSIDGHGLASGGQIDVHKLLDVLSNSSPASASPADDADAVVRTGDVARLVKSLEMTCRLDSSAPVELRSSLSQRSRPPPLILVPHGSIKSRNPLPAAALGAGSSGSSSGSSPGSSPGGALASVTLSESQSTPPLPNVVPDAHPVHKGIIPTPAAAAAPGSSEQQRDSTSLQVEVQEVPHSSSKRMHRASLILRNSTHTLRSIAHVKHTSTSTSTSTSTLKSNSPSKSKSTNVLDTLQNSSPVAKLRPTSLRLPQSLSRFRSRSVELLGLGQTTAGAPASPAQTQPQNQQPQAANLSWVPPPSVGTKTDTSTPPLPPSHLPSRSRDSQWTPPPEWDRIVVVATDSASRPSPPPSAPLPGARIGTGWSPPSEWHAKPSLPSPPSSFRLTPTATPITNCPRCPSFPASPTSHSFSQSLSYSHSHPDLRLSPSLPSLRALNSPPLSAQPRPQSGYHADHASSPSSPVTSVPSPITPYSAISLSAFPLPPPGVAPCLPPFPAEYLCLFPQESVVSSSPPPPSPSSMPTSTLTPTPSAIPSATATATATAASAPIPQDDLEESDLPTGLVAALKKMINLEHVTLRYISSSSHGNSGSNGNQSPYTSMRESIDLSLVKKANESLGTVLPTLDSLRSLDVVCQTTQHDEVCRKWWEDATRALENLELRVTCVQDVTD